MTDNHAPHLESVIFEPLWTTSKLGSFVRQHSTHYTGAVHVVTSIGFVCAAFIFRERLSLRGVSTAVTLFMCGAIGITLACLILGRDQHSAAVDDRGSSDSITPVDRAHQHDEP
ncbi:MAG: MgtC/SapB family protein [Planctomycetota bacterium]|nr:MgtC/SapB family protein [Planctomycetota bacterium]